MPKPKKTPLTGLTTETFFKLAEEARKEWAAALLEDSETVKEAVFNVLNERLEAAILSFVGIERSFGTWRFSSKKSPLGQVVQEELEKNLKTWVKETAQKFTKTKLTPKQMQGITKSYQDDFYDRVRRRMREQAYEDADEFVAYLLAKDKKAIEDMLNAKQAMAELANEAELP